MARPRVQQRIAELRAQRESQQRVRRPRTITRRDGMRCEVDGQTLLNFCGNDYLGLATQFAVSSALQDGAARDGYGSGGSALVCGRHAAHVALEQAMAEWLGYPRALLFDSGYVANLSLLQAFLGEGDVCVQDRLNHASLIDGARLSGAALRRYPHADAEGALRQLRSAPDGLAIVATDGVFSMDGDIAPLKELALVSRVQNALLHVDDAHGIGVVGKGGRGCVSDAGLGPREVPLLLVTLGKALGGHGALVLGEADLIDHLLQAARGYMYSTAPPPALAHASLEAARIAMRDEWRRERLEANIARFRAGMHERGLRLPPSDTPIQPVPCANEAAALALSGGLEKQGFWVAAIRPPSVPDAGSRLRVTLTAVHAENEIDRLVIAFAKARDALSAGASFA